MRKRIIKWELLGILIISIFGTLLHFVFEWLDYWKPVALIAAVNESVWEHLKIAFWPSFIYVFIEYTLWGKKEKNFCFSKAVNLLLIPLSIVAMFYTYTAILGRDYLVLDIAIFVLAIIIGQLASLKIVLWPKQHPFLNKLATVIILLLIIAFSLLTFYPLKNPLFKDPVKSGYGIPAVER